LRIELHNAGLRFGDHTPLFEAVNLTIEGGRFLVIQGASGCGKSSLLRLLNRLHEPTTGYMLVDGAPATDGAITDLRRRAILVPQTPIVVPGTVRDNLCWPFAFRANRRLPHPNDAALRRHLDTLLLQEVGLDDEARPLSVGQRQRLALLRALLLEPEVLLCDEPTASLDSVARTVIETQLESRCAAGCGVVVVTHQEFSTATTTLWRARLQADGLHEVAP
jgi:putative ABC transport system ATP-binding protein